MTYRIILILVLVFFPAFSMAKKNATLNRGGLGFLYLDHNSFVNPGQIAADAGTGIELLYTRQEVSSVTIQNATPSVSYSSGKYAVGAFLTRSAVGGNLSESDSTIDLAGGQLGLALAQGKLTLGAGYQKVLDSGATTDGIIVGGFNFNSAKGKGFSFGVGTTTTLNKSTDNTIGMTAGLGYSFNPMNNNVEVNLTVPDIDNTDTYTLSGYLTFSTTIFYFSGGGSFLKTPSSDDPQLEARVGALLGKSVDVSAIARHILRDGQSPELGGSFRMVF